MPTSEHTTPELQGMYHDVLRGQDGSVLWDRGWSKNAIVGDCRVLLAAFMAGAPASQGIQGILLGAGLDTWDVGGAPPATSAQQQLVDAHPHDFQRPSPNFKVEYLQGGVVTGTPTNRIQISIHIGPGLPTWPDGNHVTTSMREFGLYGKLGGTVRLINYVTHPVITKDPASTLDRTIWLLF